MNLICPHCQQRVSVPDHLAGQTTKCPQCSGPFTVPRLEAAAFSATEPGVLPPRQEPAPPPPPPLPPSFQPGPPPPVVTGDYLHRTALYLSPRVIRWIAPTCFILIFVLLFFPWVGMYTSSRTIARQSGWGVAFGTYTKGEGRFEADVPTAPLIIMYDLLVVLGVLATIGLVVLPFVQLPVAQQILPWRPFIFGGLSLLLLLFLVLQLLFGFPMERVAMEEADARVKQVDEQVKKIQAEEGFPEETRKAFLSMVELLREVAELIRDVVPLMLQRRFWLRLVVLLNVIAVVASLADFWLQRRVGRPVPRMQFEW